MDAMDVSDILDSSGYPWNIVSKNIYNIEMTVCASDLFWGP